jgi:ABC-2 type transport system ATP-binding protein
MTRSALPRRAAVVLAVLAAATATAPAAGAAGVTKKALSFAVTTGPDSDVPCTIVADLYTPEGASAANPAPAILATNGFGGSKDDFAALGQAYAERGYVFLAYSGLGFGGSGCKITLDDPDYDGQAGSQLVSFLGGTKAAVDGTTIDSVVKDGPGDPRVGMTGLSYGGEIQFAIAGRDPRVDALNPQITWNDLDYALAGNNTDVSTGVRSKTPGVAKLDWPTLFTGVGITDPFPTAITAGDTSHLGVCPNFADQVCPGLLLAASTGHTDPTTQAFLQRASVSSYIEKIKVPVFLAQGQNDTLFDLQEAVATYEALRAQGTPAKLLFRSQGHSGGAIPGESTPASPETAYESRMTLRWFDHYLRDAAPAPALDFSFFRDWVPHSDTDAIAAVGSTPSYPAGTPTSIAFPGTMSLAATPSGGTTGAALGSVPSSPPVPGVDGTVDTPALADAVEVAGLPTATFRVDAPAHAATQATTEGKLVRFARVDDVAPDGTVTTPGKIVSAARVADVTEPVRIELPGIVHRFAAGHRIRVTISTGSAIRRGNVTPGPVTISDVTLRLPELGAPAGPAGSGPDGTTPYTPVAAPQAPPSGTGTSTTPATTTTTPTAPPTTTTPPAAAPKPPAASPGTAVRPGATTPCVSHRRFVIRLPRARRGDRVRSAVVRVAGKRIRSTRTKATIDLRGRPKGTVRVTITVRTAKGRVLRSSRSYRTCG